jgi:hypothetical protein
VIISRRIYAHDNVRNGDAKMDFSKIELFIEAKLAGTSDSFRDSEDSLQTQINDFRFENGSNPA